MSPGLLLIMIRGVMLSEYQRNVDYRDYLGGRS